jgi:hypothetical protein
METIARNYRKNPHTATFLNTFHSGIRSNEARENAQRVLAEALAAGVDGREPQTGPADDNAAEYKLAQEEDLLNLVPTGAPVFTPSASQTALIIKLVLEVNELSTDLGEQAGSYVGRMDRENLWTRENTTRWIGNLIAKLRELRTAAPVAPVAPAPTAPALVEVANGRYAVEEDGVLKFFKVKNGNRPGFVFLDVQASDDWHSIRNLGRIRAILALIAEDPEGALCRYGQELGVCGDCGRTLTDETSRAIGRGPICRSR